MSDAGNALLGIGMGTGENRATEAAMAAVSSPLLETSMDGARSILLSITGGKDLSLWEVNEAAKAVSAAAHIDANNIAEPITIPLIAVSSKAARCYQTAAAQRRQPLVLAAVFGSQELRQCYSYYDA